MLQNICDFSGMRFYRSWYVCTVILGTSASLTCKRCFFFIFSLQFVVFEDVRDHLVYFALSSRYEYVCVKILCSVIVEAGCVGLPKSVGVISWHIIKVLWEITFHTHKWMVQLCYVYQFLYSSERVREERIHNWYIRVSNNTFSLWNL